MERIFAAIDGDIISNTFVGDDDFAALVRPDHDEVVEITGLDPMPGVRWAVHSDGYRPPQPWPSWAWNGAVWYAPVERPDTPGVWVWDEDAQEWTDLAAQG
jgi:hypothetical protein